MDHYGARCKSRNSRDKRCRKDASHVYLDLVVTHQRGDFTWIEPEVWGTQAHQAMEAAATFEIDLATWWRELAEQEIGATVPKAVEYGSTDLLDIGAQLGRFIGHALTDAQAAEFGCWFYLIGKLARATSALERADWPSDDTIKDIGIYTKMIQRIRATGSWPGEEL